MAAIRVVCFSCVGSAWKILPVIACSLCMYVCLSVVTNRAGQPRQPLRGVGRGAGGPASNQTKIQFKKKIIFIIEHIFKTIICLKNKIENRKKNT
jgi:hypothetical protein